MSGVVLNSRFMTRLLTSGEEDFEHVSMIQDSLSTACELTVLILFILSVTFSVTCLTDCCIFSFEIMPATLANTFLFILQGSAPTDLGCGGRFRVHLVAVNFCLQQ